MADKGTYNNDLKLNNIEFEMSGTRVDEVRSQADNASFNDKDESNEYIVITVNDYDVW